MLKRVATLFALTLLVGLVASGVSRAATRASLPDIEDEVMCPTCEVPLNQAFSPQAERERQFIRREIERGRTKDEIKRALVAEFGEEVLATPRGEGFDLAAYLVPAIAVAVAAAALAVGLLRWRRRAPPVETQPDPAAADAARLENDLSRYEL